MNHNDIVRQSFKKQAEKICSISYVKKWNIQTI